MKLKYFLRGLGTGVIFGALIMLVAYMTSGGYKLSDEEIIKRAEKLGMVSQEPIIKDSIEEAVSENENTTEKATTEKVTTEETTTEKVTTEETTTEETTTEEKNTEATTTEEVTTQEATTEEKTTEASAKQDGKIIKFTLTVASGMSSTEVARIIQEAGIKEDYLDFDAYLNSNGYSTKIGVKTTELTSNMTYEEIALALTSGEDEN